MLKKTDALASQPVDEVRSRARFIAHASSSGRCRRNALPQIVVEGLAEVLVLVEKRAAHRSGLPRFRRQRAQCDPFLPFKNYRSYCELC